MTNHLGDKGDNFYIVDSGTCEIYVKKEGVEEEQLVKTVEAGDYFGELALMYGTPRAATIIVNGVNYISLIIICRLKQT